MPKGDGTVIHAAKGDLTCHGTTTFDVVSGDHPFVDLCVIEGGTGIYAGASGYIKSVGTFDFSANQGESDYFGKLVLPD
jgi:hypothetical protein